MDSLSQEVTLIIVSCIFLLIVAVGIILLVLIYQKKQYQHLRDREQLKMNFEKQILESRLEIQEQTLKYISQEIHDNIGQVLTLTKMNIQAMNPDFPADLQEKISDSKHLVGKAIQDLRDLSKSLNTDYIFQKGLEQSILSELELIKKHGSYNVQFNAEGTGYKLEQQKELILFRIFQEVVNNILKHAAATSIHVRLTYLNTFELQISDDGKGFDPALLGQKPADTCAGIGISNMKNRANLIGAGFSIQSSFNQGTTVKIVLAV